MITHLHVTPQGASAGWKGWQDQAKGQQWRRSPGGVARG